jgi:hypothetical protein
LVGLRDYQVKIAWEFFVIYLLKFDEPVFWQLKKSVLFWKLEALEVLAGQVCPSSPPLAFSCSQDGAGSADGSHAQI